MGSIRGFFRGLHGMMTRLATKDVGDIFYCLFNLTEKCVCIHVFTDKNPQPVNSWALHMN